ncbi:hypothetical protein SAMN04244572_02372 [Azotobacter beijerinckii]|uniref:Uncharacterized protein n=1 Tax=Azotobacter beijerinckii TaxID=170623 RepID=A0A1H6V4C1_9GAMM|nr:hypothetical protein [Azotobacter beijerinckii]SEI99489.1 hypothetical protein SAMN04244572_02372 [Azotobacter beijerinckii]
MLSIDAKGFKASADRLRRIERQMPFATALALTRTAQLAKEAIEQDMRAVFDRPTRWTLNSLRLIPARKDRLEARVWMKNESDKAAPATRWLSPQVEGGPRPLKRSEALLRKKGRLPADRFVVPARDARLDRYGNLSRGQVQKILSGMGAQFDAYQNSTTSRRSIGNRKRYFAMRRGSELIGIAERTGKRRIGLLLAYVGQPSYTRRLDFYGVGNRVVGQHLQAQLDKALAEALRGGR